MPNLNPSLNDISAGDVGASVILLRGILVARAPQGMEKTALERMQSALLTSLVAHHCRYAVVDCTQVEVMDEVDAQHLCRVLATVSLIGAVPLLSGLQPGVAASLADFDSSFWGGVRMLRDLDDTLQLEV